MNAPADDALAPREHLTARARVRDVVTGGRRTRWRGFGDGPPLVLLPGGHGGTRRPRGELRAWRELARAGDVTAIPASQGAALADGRAERVVRVVDGAGHWAQYEAPRAVDRMLLDWFAAR